MSISKKEMSYKKEMPDEYGYLPAKKDMTMELKKLIKRYAPISYADYDIAQLINEFDSISDMSTDQKYTIIMNGSGTWYQFFKNNLYTFTSWTDLFLIKKKYIAEEIYTTRCIMMWNKIKEIREAISWELQPALEAQLVKEKAPAAASAAAAAAEAASASAAAAEAASASAAAAPAAFYKFPAVGGTAPTKVGAIKPTIVGGAGEKKAIPVKETATHGGIINAMDATKSVSKLVQIEYILSKSSFTKKELKHLIHIMCEKAKEKDM
jgi:hypothetical protein